MYIRAYKIHLSRAARPPNNGLERSFQVTLFQSMLNSVLILEKIEDKLDALVASKSAFSTY